jgi:hypothetical protein
MAETTPPPSGPLAGASGRELRELQQFLLYLGSALTAAGEAVNEVEEHLRRVAAAYGAPHARVSVLPTDEVSPFALRWTRNRLRTAVHQGCVHSRPGPAREKRCCLPTRVSVHQNLPANCQQQGLTTPHAAPCHFEAIRLLSSVDMR